MPLLLVTPPPLLRLIVLIVAVVAIALELRNAATLSQRLLRARHTPPDGIVRAKVSRILVRPRVFDLLFILVLVVIEERLRGFGGGREGEQGLNLAVENTVVVIVVGGVDEALNLSHVYSVTVAGGVDTLGDRG